MCAGEPFGVSRFGAEESARGITSPKLFSYCNSLLENAAVELFYCGSAPLSAWSRPLSPAFWVCARNRDQAARDSDPQKA
jgi:hypothetical protein